MASGRRQSVLIFCISPLKELYLDPIEHYDPDMIYVFRSSRENAFAKISNEIYSTTKIECNSIREVVTDTSDYGSILAEILDIREQLHKKYDDDLDIYLNISSGTHEFAAAASFASMLKKNMIAFSIDVDDYGVKISEIRDFIERLSPELNFPEKIMMGDYNEPDKEMVTFLSILRDLALETKYPKHSDIIDLLKMSGAWMHNPKKKSGRGRTPIEKREEMYLARHYFQPAIDNEWIRDSKKKIELTEKGMTILRVFDVQRRLESDTMILKSCTKAETRYNCMEHRRMDSFDDMEVFDNLTKESSMKNECISNINRESENENIIEINRKGKKYRFRVDME